MSLVLWAALTRCVFCFVVSMKNLKNSSWDFSAGALHTAVLSHDVFQSMWDCTQGPVGPTAAADVAARLFGLGCYEVSMGDTTGVGTPATVAAMFKVQLGCHNFVLICVR